MNTKKGFDVIILKFCRVSTKLKLNENSWLETIKFIERINQKLKYYTKWNDWTQH